MKCIACGSSSLVEGTVRDNVGGGQPFFYPSDQSLFRQLFFGSGSREIRAYGCIHCHNLQFGIDFKETDLERYQQFEGEQPGVLERINSNPKKLAD